MVEILSLMKASSSHLMIKEIEHFRNLRCYDHPTFVILSNHLTLFERNYYTVFVKTRPVMLAFLIKTENYYPKSI